MERKVMRGLPIAIALVLLVALVAVFAVVGVHTTQDTANAEFSIAYMAWDEDSKTVKEVEGGCAEYTVVTDTTTALADGNWYVVSENVTISDSITVSGTVNLILCDGATLTAQSGIKVSSGNTLNVYAQSTGENMGAIVATGTGNAAGIGGDYGGTGGNVNIHGGVITATGDEGAAGIGGGDCGNGGNVNIYGGIITATGDEHAGGGCGGAGIGGGEYCTGGNVNIYGGVITATGGEGAAGIGGGDAGSSNGALTVAEGYVVYGGTSADPTTVIEKSDNDYARYQYMIVTGTGTGTAEDPYRIRTRAELEKFRDIVDGLNGETQDLNACAILTADIDLNGSNANRWTPIGSYSQKYNGHFDGDGHAIEYVFVKSTESYQGLFGATGSGSVIENLRVAGSADTDGGGTQALGGIVGYACGTIRNCVNEVNVQGDQDNTIAVGGIAGVLDGGAVTRCANYNGDIGTSLSYVGGIVGQAKGTCSITDCYNLSFVGAKQNGAGGIVGGCAADSHVTIARCFCYDARIFCNNGKKGAIIGAEPTGENASISFENCYFYIDDEDMHGSGERNETANITLKTAEQFKNTATFVGWDFNNVWIMDELHPIFVYEFNGSMITIEIDDKEINYNEAAPAYTYVAKIGGVAVTDTDLLAAIAEKLTITCDYVQGNDADTYAIINSNASYGEKFSIDSQNYKISTIVDGALTVDRIASAVSSAPAAVANLSYTGSAQTLISAGTATGGTMYYKVGRSEYATTLPQATNAGTYTVYYKVVGDTNHNDSAEGSLEVTIAATASTGRELGSAYLDGTDPDVIVDSNDGGSQENPGGSNGEWSWWGYGAVERSSYNGTNTAFFTGTQSVFFQYNNTAGTKVRAIEIIVSGCSAYNIIGSSTGGTINNQNTVRNGENETVRIIFNVASEGTIGVQFVPQGGGSQSFHLVGIRIFAQSYNVITFDKNGGVGGDDSVICYQADIAPTITPPTKDGYVFDGYYDENYETRYFKATGGYKSFMYNDTADMTLYAKWLLPMSVTATGYTGEYDGNGHSITVNVTAPADGYAVTYKGQGESSYVSENPSYTAMGTYTVDFKVVDNSGEYATYSGSATVTIEKLTPSYTAPTPRQLYYTGGSQELIERGSTGDGEMEYSLDGENWSVYTPEGEEVGTYTVYFKIFGDGNHKNLTDSVTVKIEKATPAPVYPEETITVKYWSTLSTAEGVPSYWSWVDPTTRVEEIPNSTPKYAAIYTPDDTDHYNTVTSELEVLVQDGILDVSVVQSGKYVCTGDEQTVSVTKTETVANDIPVTYEFSLNEYGYYESVLPTFTDEGVYTVYYNAYADYHEDASGSFTVKILHNLQPIEDVYDAKMEYVDYFNPYAYHGRVTKETNGVLEDVTLRAFVEVWDDYAGDYGAFVQVDADNMGDPNFILSFTVPTEYPRTKGPDYDENAEPVFDPAYTQLLVYGDEPGVKVALRKDVDYTIDADGNVVVFEYRAGSSLFIHDTRPIIRVVTSASPSTITYGDSVECTFEANSTDIASCQVALAEKELTASDVNTEIWSKMKLSSNFGSVGTYSIIALYEWYDYEYDEDYNEIYHYYNLYTVLDGFRVVPGESGTLVINPKTIGISWGNNELTYNGSSQAPSATPTGVRFGDEVKLTVTGKQKNAGSGYTATVTGVSNSNYVLPDTGLTCEYSIGKATLDFTVSIDDWKYGQSQKNIVYSGTYGNGTRRAYVKKSGDPDTAYQSMSGSYPTEVGDYVLKVTIDETSNYFEGEETTTFSIEKADINPSLAITGWTYGNEPNAPSVSGNTENGVVTYYYKLTSEDDDAYDETVPTDAGNYTIKAVVDETEHYSGKTVTSTFTIAKKALTVTGITASDKTYDGNTSVTLVYTGMEVEGIVDQDDVTVTATGAFDNKNIGNNKNVGFTEITLDGADANNYSVSAGSQDHATASISARTVIISGILAEDKDYDGTTAATLDYDEVYFEGAVDGDELTITATGTFADKNYSESAMTVSVTGLTLGGGDAANYVLAGVGQQTETTAYINRKAVSVSGIVAENKDYDGTTAATIIYDNVNFDGIVGGEALTVSTTGTFANKNAGSNKTVTFGELTLGGDDVANYYVADDSQTYTTATIAAIPVKVTGITVADRVYNGSAVADVICADAVFTGKIGDDELTVSATGAFADKNAGVAKTVTFGALVLGGADADNYYVADDSQASTTASISAKEIVVSGITVSDKIYDGTAAATFVYSAVVLGGKLDGDDLSVIATGAFSNKNVGEEKVVTFSLTFDGAEKNNYVLKEGENVQQTTATATISAKPIVISGITAQNKTYDTTTVATLVYSGVTYEGIVGGENLTVTATGTFASENASVDAIDVAIGNIALGGNDVSNYILANAGQQTATSAYIGKKTIGINWSDTELTYNTSEQVPTATATDVCDGDEVTLTVTGKQKNAGSNYVATVTGIDNDNYALPDTGLTCEFTIAKADLDFTVSINSWVYGNDIPNAYLYGSYGDATKRYWVKPVEDPDEEENWKLLMSVGSNLYPVEVGNYVLKVTSDENQNYNSGEARTTFSIYTKQIVVSGVAVDEKVYDGTTDATFNYENVVLSGNLDGDGLSVVATGSFADKNVENGKTVEFTLALAGDKKNNYVLATEGQQSSATADITAREIVVSGIAVDNKVYDKTTVATFNYTNVVLTGNLDGNALSVVATGAFEDKDVETEKEVAFTLTLIGDEKDNYVLAENGQQTYAFADITAKEIVVSGIAVDDKIYDATTNATFNYNTVVLDGNLDGENLSVIATGAFADKNVEAGKVVTFTLELDGTEKNNYVLKTGENVQQSSATAEITAKEIVVSGIAVDDKIYDATTNATFNYANVVLDGNLDGENLSVIATGAFSDKNVGADKTVTFTLALDGEDKNNYVLKEGVNVQQTAATASISVKEIVVSGIAASDRSYDGTLAVEFDYDDVALDGMVDGDDLSVVATGELFDKNVGADKVVVLSSLELVGEDSNNYVLKEGENVQQSSATVNITEKAITVTIVGKTSVYGEEPASLTATTAAGAIEEGDDVPYTLACVVTATSDVGTYAVTGTDVSDNYDVTFVNGQNAYEVTKRPITATAQNKVVNFAEDEPLYTFTLSEDIPEDVLAELTERTTLTCDVDTAVSGRYDIVFAFAGEYETDTVLQNYAVTLAGGKLTVNKRCVVQDLTVDGLDPAKEYEVNIDFTTLEDNDNVKKADVSVVIKHENGEEEPYEGEADLTVAIPEPIDPAYFDLYREDDGVETLIAPDDYETTKDGKIVIHSIVPVRFVFKNTKGQIFVKADDKKIHDGDALPTYTFTVTGWDANGLALTSDVIETVKAAVVGSTNYRSGETGVFSIGTAFIQDKDQYTAMSGYRVLLDNASLTVLPKMISDNDVEVTIENVDDAFDLDISLEVQIKTDVQTNESGVDYKAIAAKFVDRRSEISAVYAVTLLQTVTENGVETTKEIQPEDIKPGTVLIIKMAVPEHLRGRKFHILHIHAADDVEYVDDSKVEVKDGFVYVKADRLSDFAFVNLKDNEEMGHKSFCIGWILFILDCIMLIYLVIHIVLKRRRLLGLIGLVASGAVVLFGILIICLHLCIITIVSFILAVLIFLAFLILFLLDRRNKKEEKEEETVQEEESAVVVAAEPEEIEEAKDGIGLKESLAIAAASTRKERINKAYVAAYLKKHYPDCVEVNRRGNYTKTGLPLADTHYVTVGGKICFIYVYETEGATMLLLKTKDALGEELAKEHSVVRKSAFPKAQDRWYSVIIDDSITNAQVEDMIDRTIALYTGKTAPKKTAYISESHIDPEEEGLSLRETLDVARHTLSHSAINKKYIIEYLKKYGDDAELNGRDNFTKTGLPLSDTHYAVRKDGKKVCFVYVYETGTTVLLLRLEPDYAEKLIEKHDNVSKSAFPKSKDHWYSLIIDDTFSNKEIERILDDAYGMAR